MKVYGHTGVYLYRRDAFRLFTRSPQSPLEKAEKLEQLRALELGIPIIVVPADRCPVNVDRPADLKKAERCLRKPS